jgi:hypothetical protein
LLAKLTEINNHFEKWFLKDETRAEALRHRIGMDVGSVAKLLDHGRHRRDDDSRIMEELGFSAALWNGALDAASAAISFHCSCFHPRLKNVVLLNLPVNGGEGGQALDFEALRRIMLILVRCFDPDWGVVTSHRLRDEIIKIPVGEPTAGWSTYLSRKYGTFEPRAGYEVERVRDMGQLLIATHERFDLDRPEHVGAALEVAKRILASDPLASDRDRRS